jgi:hypothetical protein
MSGVDLADQLLDAFKLECRIEQRTWIPLFLQCLDVARTNSYIVYKARTDPKIEQKTFVLNWIAVLNDRAASIEFAQTRAAAVRAAASPPVPFKKKKKRQRYGEKDDLPVKRLREGEHVLTPTNQGQRRYCAFLHK